MLKGLSIGYDAVRSVMKDGVRLLQEVKLYEVSTTAFPMNEMATVTSVKSDPVGQFRRMMAQYAKEIRGS